MRTALTYTLSRLILFVVVLLLLDLAGARGILLIALALLISGLLSYVLLSRQRDAMAGSLGSRLSGRTRRASSFRARLDEGARAEDPVDDPAEDTADGQAEPAAPAPAPAPDQR
jgi:Zn-dependent protease with chaperone function